MPTRRGSLVAALVILLHGTHALARTIRLASWNVLYKALDDPLGRRAIISTLDGAANGTMDFVVVVEAAGDTPKGSLRSWTSESQSLRPCGSQCGALSHVSVVDRHETLALFYNGSKWDLDYDHGGSFDIGRPFLIAHFRPKDSRGPDDGLWVVAVHLPHFRDTLSVPGEILATNLTWAAKASGNPTRNVVLAGDWNEFQWEDNPVWWPALDPYRLAAARAPVPLLAHSDTVPMTNPALRSAVHRTTTGTAARRQPLRWRHSGAARATLKGGRET